MYRKIMSDSDLEKLQIGTPWGEWAGENGMKIYPGKIKQ
jgi:hypothetical protein